MSAPCTAISVGMAVHIIEHGIPPGAATPADQVASGRGYGGGAVPGRNRATVPGRPEAGDPRAGTVEPAAGPAESSPAAAGQFSPGAPTDLPGRLG